MHDLLEANGRMNNFRRLAGQSNAAQIGPVYSDSDIYKWMEAIGFVLQSGDRPELRSTTEKMIDEVIAVQEPSGYLNTYYVGDRASERMTPQTQSTGHELYCIGHMLQGAIAYYRATGDRKLLDAGIRFVDNFLMPNYGPAPKKPIVSGHPEIELALIELYRITGDKRQLDLAGYILQGDERAKFPDQAGRPRGTRHVRLLRRDRLLPGNRRPRLLEDSDHLVGRPVAAADVHFRRSRGPRRRRGVWGGLRIAQRTCLRRKLRRHWQHDVELAHARRQR
jgi:DUF1680 family protein